MIALDLMLGHEGGYVNNPKDQGVPKSTVLHRTLVAHRGVPSVPLAEMKVLTKE